MLRFNKKKIDNNMKKKHFWLRKMKFRSLSTSRRNDGFYNIGLICKGRNSKNNIFYCAIFLRYYNKKKKIGLDTVTLCYTHKIVFYIILIFYVMIFIP